MISKFILTLFVFTHVFDNRNHTVMTVVTFNRNACFPDLGKCSLCGAWRWLVVSKRPI